jgi:hypothetical protein
VLVLGCDKKKATLFDKNRILGRCQWKRVGGGAVEINLEE